MKTALRRLGSSTSGIGQLACGHGDVSPKPEKEILDVCHVGAIFFRENITLSVEESNTCARFWALVETKSGS